MLSANIVLVTSLVYAGLLFALAFFSERANNAGFRRLLRSPVVYTLSISVYCTSWTFYGAVGTAARTGFDFAAIYLGPTIVFVGWWFLLRKLVRIGQIHRITSIADLISSRFGKSPTLAVLVTFIAVMGTTPYIALQLNAISTSFGVVSGASVEVASRDVQTGFWLAVALAMFTIFFGTRNVDANEHHPGVVAAIAFEALVKLFALLAVGLFVVFGIGGGVAEVFDLPSAHQLLESEKAFGPRWVTLTFLSAVAIICLPRQFQVTVVENADERHLSTASWLFPLYLFLISLFILPIAIVGLSAMPVGSNPDMFVLTLPLTHDQDALALFAFIGGFSSATSMIIVASIALSIMVSNHIVVPVWLSLQSKGGDRGGGSGDIKSLLLTSRRLSIAFILMLGFLYYWLSSATEALASIGLIAFAGVAQFLPSILAGIYWRTANAAGAITGLSVGFVVWLGTLLLPSIESDDGRWWNNLIGFDPQSLLDTGFQDPLINTLFWSLSLNTLLLVMVSLLTTQKPIDRLQGTLFVDVFRDVLDNDGRAISRVAAVDDLFVLTQRILGSDEAFRMFREEARKQNIDGNMPLPDASFISRVERRLAGTIGGASARVLVSQVASGETISLDEVIQLVDETQQIIDYSRQLEEKSTELENTARQLRYANDQLVEIDAQKDDFLSHVSHEVRTPMTSIRSFAEILRDAPEMDPAQAKRFLGIIHDESLRLTRLLDQILELSRLESGEGTMNLANVDAEASLERAIATCRALAEAQDVSLDDATRVPAAWLQTDADRLTQVFINLITNAIKYNTNPDPKVDVSSTIADDAYRVVVSDNGPGIERSDHEKIFKKFARGWNQGREGKEGTGLGLAISREIVRALGGELTLEKTSSKYPGVTFIVTLPLEPSDA